MLASRRSLRQAEGVGSAGVAGVGVGIGWWGFMQGESGCENFEEKNCLKFMSGS